MRKRVLALVVVAFAGWFAWKALPFLRVAQPAVWETPTVSPGGPAPLQAFTAKGGQHVCIDHVDFGPQARWVQIGIQASRFPAPAIRVEARAPGYRAVSRIPAGAAAGSTPLVALRPAAHDAGDGTLCLVPEGRHTMAFMGTTLGRNSSPSTTTVDGQAIGGQISVTLLSSPAQSMGSRLGDLAAHLAGFRPVTGWEVFLLGLLVVLGAPLLVGVALARAAAQDADSARR